MSKIIIVYLCIMYNLAKLLTDEPEKLERLIILFLKLLITFTATALVFGYDISISSLIDNPIPKTYSASKLVYFFTSLILIWFFLWSVVAELILYELPVWLCSRTGDKRRTLLEMLHILDVIKMNSLFTDKPIIRPGKYIIPFTEVLKEQQESRFIDKSTSRLRQYYIISIATFILLLLVKDITLSCGKIIGCVLLILLLFKVCVYFNKMKSYINDNSEELIREFEPMSYSRKVHSAIRENKTISENYQLPQSGWGKEVINLKPEISELLPTRKYFPKQIKFIPAFHWNNTLGQELMMDGLSKRSKKDVNLDCLTLFISNISPTDTMSAMVMSQKSIVYIYANSEEEIFSGLEEAFFKIKKQNFNKEITNGGSV